MEHASKYINVLYLHFNNIHEKVTDHSGKRDLINIIIWEQSIDHQLWFF